MNKEPVCYSDAESIVNAVMPMQDSEEKSVRPADDPERLGRDAGLIIGFFERPGLETKADYHSNLLLLQADSGWRVRGDLNVTPGIDNLPQIERTGHNSPFMSGHLLGFDDDAITDASLQRARCLPFCRSAAYQEWIYLLTRILITQGSMRLEIDIPEELSMGQVGDRLRDVLNEGREFLRISAENRPERVNPLKQCCVDLLEAGAKLPQQWQKHLERSLTKLHESDHANEATDHPLCLKLCLTLLVSLQKEIYDKRHLGKERWVRLTDGKNYVIQGAGDLSMNAWNVAIYRERGDSKPKVVIPFQEPSASRTYHCLLAWKDDADLTDMLKDAKKSAVQNIAKRSAEYGSGITLREDLAIAEFRVSKIRPMLRLYEPEHERRAKKPQGGSKRGAGPLEDLIEFALYGKLVLRNGELVRKSDVVEEFQDLRHVFDLPNLNPPDGEIKDILFKQVCDPAKLREEFEKPGLKRDITDDDYFSWFEQKFAERVWNPDPPSPPTEAAAFLLGHRGLLRTMLRRPRVLFNRFQSENVWLMESALLTVSNLKHLACEAAISVPLNALGAPQDWVEFRLLGSGYRRKERRVLVKEPGDFAWDDAEKGNLRLHIHLLDAHYPCTMIGIGSPQRQGGDPGESGKGASEKEKRHQGDTLYLLAWGHDFRYGRHSVWGCADVLRAAGAQYALVIDEGQDVFQCYIESARELRDLESDEQDGGPLDRLMPVPFVHEQSNGLRLLKRTGQRASVAFWQALRK